MNDGLLANRYATALLDYADQSDSSDRVYTETKTVVKSYSQFADLKRVLDNPFLLKSEKKKIVLMAAGGNVSKPFERFIDLVFVNNREEHLQSITLKYIDLYRKQKNIHSGRLITAAAVDSPIEKRLMSAIEKETGGTIELEKIVDPSILGGFLFEVDFVRWDASLSGQLKRIKEEYIEQNKRVL
jgi:F-type H+-transporting ATPase subunit delta